MNIRERHPLSWPNRSPADRRTPPLTHWPAPRACRCRHRSSNGPNREDGLGFNTAIVVARWHGDLADPQDAHPAHVRIPLAERIFWSPFRRMVNLVKGSLTSTVRYWFQITWKTAERTRAGVLPKIDTQGLTQSAADEFVLADRFHELVVEAPRITEAREEANVAEFRRWRFAPDFVTPTTALHELPGPVKREVDLWITEPCKGFDVDNNRSLLIDEQEVRHMSTHSPIDCRLQEKRLRDDTWGWSNGHHQSWWSLQL